MQTLIKELQQYIERMDEFQLRIVLGFIKKLFELTD